MDYLSSLDLLNMKQISDLKKMEDFESFIIAIDIDYDSGDVIFTWYAYKLSTTQLKVVKRSAYAKGTN